MPDTTTRAQEIRAELDRLAPLKQGDDITAVGLALYCAMEAQLAWARMTGMEHPITPVDIAIINGYFSTAHALMYAAGMNAAEANKAAAEIRDAWEDPGAAGEWIHDHLGGKARRVATLAEELAHAIEIATAPDGLSERVAALAAQWEQASDDMREQSVREGLHPALARGHQEANRLRERAADLRAVLAGDTR